MKTGFLKALALTTALATMTVPALPQTTTPPPQTFGTTIYLDYSFWATKEGPITSNALNNKFAFRRAYFTYENKISADLKFRFRFDAENARVLTSTTGSTNEQLKPFMKHLYLDWAGLLPNSSLKIGMTETMAFKVAEDRWGLRSVAKTLVDGYKDVTGADIRASSADIGINLTGAISKELRYGAMVMNGEGYSRPELNKYKKFGGCLQFVPLPGLNVWGYAEYEKVADGQDAQMYKVDVYFDMVPGLNVTGEWFTYDSDAKFNKVNNADGTSSNAHFNIGGFSIFATYKITPDKLHVFARYDGYRPDSTNGAKDVSLVIAGVDWTPFHPSWKIQPNVWFYSYKDSAKKDDVIVNFTAFLSF